MKIKFHETGVSFSAENVAELSYLRDIRSEALVNEFEIYDFDGRGFNEVGFGFGVKIPDKVEE